MPGFVQKLQIASITSSALSSATATYASANTAGNMLCTSVSWYGATTTVSIGDSANNTWTVMPVVANGATQCQAVAYCLNCVASASNTVTVTLGAARTYLSINGGEWNGYRLVDFSNSATGTVPAAATVNVTTTDGNDLLIGFGRLDNGTKWSAAPSGWTSRASTLPAGVIVADTVAVSTGTSAFTPTTTSVTNGNPWTIQMIAFAPVQLMPGRGTAGTGAASTTLRQMARTRPAASGGGGANVNLRQVGRPKPAGRAAGTAAATLRKVNTSITLSTTTGISSILYGADAHNFVDTTYSALPLLRIQQTGQTGKTYEPLGSATISTTNKPNDTLTMSSANVTMKIVVVTGLDGYGFQVSFPVYLYTSCLDWDLRLYTHKFETTVRAGVPTYADGTTLWLNGQNGYDCNFALEIVAKDPGQAVNPWQCWYSTLGPLTMMFNPKNYNSSDTGWEMYFKGVTLQPGYLQEFPLFQGAIFDTNVKFFATQPDPTVVAPTAFTIQANRWPVITRQDLFPKRSLIGLNILCQSPPGGVNPVQNPNGWFGATPTLALYNTSGDGRLVAETTGDETALVSLASQIIGRLRWCNYITYVLCGGLSVIHWDFWDGEEYPQSGTSYVGDPRISRTQCRELWYRSATFPVSIMQQFLDNLKYAWNGTNPPTYCPNLQPGIALRASNWPNPAMYTNPAPTQYSWQSQADALANLSAKIDRVYWAGFRVFYVDSWGNAAHPPAYQVISERAIMPLYPDILMCPESYNRVDMYSAGYPFRDNYPSIRSDPQANMIWPNNAHALCRMENKGNISLDPLNANYPNAVSMMNDAWAGGDCPLANCYSGVLQIDGSRPTELQQVYAYWHTLH